MPLSSQAGAGNTADHMELGQIGQPRHFTPRLFTPSASVAGDQEEQYAPPQGAPPSHAYAPPQGAPPTYAESVDLGSDRVVASGPTAHGDHKVQADADLNGENDESSDLDDDDESIVTLSALVDEDEAAWVLDEYAASHEPPSYEDATNVPSEDEIVRDIIAGQQAYERELSRGQLPCPVIIPQRRQRTPDQRSRGFVRAYAPILENVGVDQATFMRFLKGLHKASQSNSWFTVIEVSGASDHAAGPAIGFAVEAAIKSTTSSTNGLSLDASQRPDNFLDRMNAELFKPAGTFAFLMKYKVNPDFTAEDSGLFGVVAANINLATNQVVAKYDRDGSDNGAESLVNKMQMFRIASGTTTLDVEDLPAGAPLIFPEVDTELARHGKEPFKGTTAGAQSMLQDYIERRAQILSPHVHSSIFGEKAELKSVEPEKTMWNTGVVGFLTGGYVDLRGMIRDRHAARWDARQERREAREERRHDRREARHERRAERSQRTVERGVRRLERRHGLSPSSSSTSMPRAELREPAPSLASHAGESSATGRGARHRRHKRSRRGQTGTVSKKMGEDVVYLMIVNLPEDNKSQIAI